MSETLACIIERRLSRRAFLAQAAAAGAVGCAGVPVAPSPPPIAVPGFTFEPLAPALDDAHHVSPGHRVQVLLGWGDPLWDEPVKDPAALTGEEQARRFGFNNDFVAVFPMPDAPDRLLLCANHESSTAALMWEDEKEEGSRDPARIEVEMAAHGLSILEIARTAEGWTPAKGSPYTRRITAHTPCALTGPASGSTRLRTPADPSGTTALGTLANCAGGVTPWGTLLTGEENVDGYFHRAPEGGAEAENHARLGCGPEADRHWHTVDDRFDVAKVPTELNRFGWVVEIDPFDPASTPKKRTALGRFKHEGAGPVVDENGRIALYLGDDQRFEYLYKFVSDLPFDPAAPQAAKEALDQGTLYVARFDDDGALTWLPLVHGQGPLTSANGFRDQADVLVEARRAGDLLGATRMDRPEDVEANPLTGRVYAMLTNNTRRKESGNDSVNPANPRVSNAHGHILEIVAPGAGKGDHASTTARWEVLLLAGRSEHGALYGVGATDDQALSCPDNCAFDPSGRLWVTTDGSNGSLRIADGLYGVGTSGPHRGVPRRFFAAPRGAEVTGPCFSPDGATLFVSVQHPDPDARWPEPDKRSRPCVVAITRDDGGVLG